MRSVYARKEEEEISPLVDQQIKVPKILLTFDQVKREIDKDKGTRPACPDAVARAVLACGHPEKKIEEVRNALAQIFKAAATDAVPGSFDRARYAFKVLSTDKTAGMFVANVDAFVEIAKASGKYAGNAFYALSSGKIASLFENHVREFVEIARYAGLPHNPVHTPVFDAFMDEKVLSLFESHINEFVEIAKAAGNGAEHAFRALATDKISGLFISNPGLVVQSFVRIAKAAGRMAPWAFENLPNDKAVSKFEDFCNKKTTLDILMLNIGTSDYYYAIELGRKLDQLHDNAPERAKYLATLSKMDVLTLVLSNPEYFYTSTNHLLFDRLNRDFKPGELARFLEKNGLEGTEPHLNLIFRAANYGRLYGKGNSIFGKNDLQSILSNLTKPLEADGFDPKYYYLLANSLEGFEKNFKGYVQGKVEAAQAALQGREGDVRFEEKCSALNFILGEIQSPNKRAAFFDANNYRDKDGKLLVVQVFDKDDTEKDHWGLSQAWFEAKYGTPKTGSSGELVYESKDAGAKGARIILYMGETKDANQQFVSSMLDKSPNMILTFRGHSFDLDKNMPANIFANRKANILFLPGSCGSAGSIPAYMEANPNVSFEFVANTSTGRGQVTNALIDVFTNEAASKLHRSFREIITGDKNNCSLVEKNGGDCATLKVDSEGERLIKYVNAQVFGR